MTEEVKPRFVALGCVWLDDIRTEGKPSRPDVPGGSVTFATLGARLFASDDPSTIIMIFNAGSDFPETILQAYRRWNVNLIVHKHHDRLSARGIVYYESGNGNRKAFERQTPPLPIVMKDLDNSLKRCTRAFHIFGTPEDIEEQFGDCLLPSEDQNQHAKPHQRFVVWEPHAKSCQPSELVTHLEALRLVDVFSPNHEELARFFSTAESAAFDRRDVETQAKVFLEAGVGPNQDGCVLVRAAEHGCLILQPGSRPTWLPAFYHSDSEMITDPTGAGNAFLGAFAIGWQETADFVEAAQYGQIGASFIIEQVGLPEVSGEGADEVWNQSGVRQRLELYRRRLIRD